MAAVGVRGVERGEDGAEMTLAFWRAKPTCDDNFDRLSRLVGEVEPLAAASIAICDATPFH